MPETMTPVQVATYARQKFPAGQRGALLMPTTTNGDLVLAVYGNDRSPFDRRSDHEAALVQRWLTAAGAQELGFGVSPDGRSWALVVKVGTHRYETEVARAFDAELVRMEVEEELQRAWAEACRAHRAAVPRRRVSPGRQPVRGHKK